MKAKDKAKELFDKIYDSKDYDGYCNGCGLVFEQAKDIALIAVDEIIKAMDDVMLPNPFKQYWEQVKQEIEKYETLL